MCQLGNFIENYKICCRNVCNAKLVSNVAHIVALVSNTKVQFANLGFDITLENQFSKLVAMSVAFLMNFQYQMVVTMIHKFCTASFQILKMISSYYVILQAVHV